TALATSSPSFLVPTTTPPIVTTCMSISAGSACAADVAGAAASRAGASAHRATRRDAVAEEAAGLALPQLGVVAAAGEQLGVASLLHDAAAVEHDEAVHAGDGRQPVGDGDHRL